MIFLGIKLAKNVFALHGVNTAGRPILVRTSVQSDQLPSPSGSPRSRPE